MARVKTRKRIVQSPVKWVMYSIGFAVRSSCQSRQASQQSGNRDSVKSRTLVQRFAQHG